MRKWFGLLALFVVSTGAGTTCSYDGMGPRNRDMVGDWDYWESYEYLDPMSGTRRYCDGYGMLTFTSARSSGDTYEARLDGYVRCDGFGSYTGYRDYLRYRISGDYVTIVPESGLGCARRAIAANDWDYMEGWFEAASGYGGCPVEGEFEIERR